MTDHTTPLSAQEQRRFQKLFTRGTQLLHKGDYERALRLLQRAHQLDPVDVDAAVNLGGTYILQKKFKAAIPILEKISKIAPDNPMVWTNLGAAHLGNPILARDTEQKNAIAAFERALAINPTTPNVAYNLGLIHRDRQEYEQAIAWFQRALKVNPQDRDARLLLQRLEDQLDEEE